MTCRPENSGSGEVSLPVGRGEGRGHTSSMVCCSRSELSEEKASLCVSLRFLCQLSQGLDSVTGGSLCPGPTPAPESVLGPRSRGGGVGGHLLGPAEEEESLVFLLLVFLCAFLCTDGGAGDRGGGVTDSGGGAPMCERRRPSAGVVSCSLTAKESLS